MMAYILFVVLLISLGAHLVLATSLLRRSWYKGLLSLVCTPLAPYWGFQAGFRIRVLVWLGSVAVYAVLRAFV